MDSFIAFYFTVSLALLYTREMFCAQYMKYWLTNWHVISIWIRQAQQEVPSWLEEYAFTSLSSGIYNPQRKDFATSDLRKVK